jgi:hypothetical protein
MAKEDLYVLPRCQATGKVAFRKRDAETIKNHRTRGKDTRKNHKREDYLRVYHCDFCNFWHLTSRR